MAEPTRIVSLEPSITSIIVALGQQDRLVAVSRYCDQLAEVGTLPRIPSTWSADTQAIMALTPDLVIASVPYQAEGVVALLQAGLNVLCLYPRCLADVYTHIIWLGGLTGVSEQANRVVTQMQTDLEVIHQENSRRSQPRVYVEMWPKPTMSSPLWVAELVDIAGGIFVPETPGRQVSTHEMCQVDPEIIIIAWAGVGEPNLTPIKQRAGWENITALQTGRVVAVDEIYLNAPGPNLVEGAQQLAAKIATSPLPVSSDSERRTL